MCPWYETTTLYINLYVLHAYAFAFFFFKFFLLISELAFPNACRICCPLVTLRT